MFERPVLAEERDLYIISDEASFDPEKLHTIVCNTLSKNYGMSGWRLGYVITNAELLHQILKVGLRGRFLKCGCRRSVNQECGVNIGIQDKCECSAWLLTSPDSSGRKATSGVRLARNRSFTGGAMERRPRPRDLGGDAADLGEVGHVSAADQITTGHPTRGVMDTYEDSWWRENYGDLEELQQDRGYEYYRPAFRYGWDSHSRHRGKSWVEVESELERDWGRREEETHKWDEAKRAIRHAFDRAGEVFRKEKPHRS